MEAIKAGNDPVIVFIRRDAADRLRELARTGELEQTNFTTKSSARNPFTPYEKERISQMASEKKNFTEIARELGRDKSTIRLYCISNQIICVSGKIRWVPTQEEKEIIRDLASKEKSLKEIGDKIPQKLQTLKAYMIREKIPFKKRKFVRLTEEDTNIIIDLAKEGKTPTEISVAINRVDSVITYVLRKNGLYKKSLNQKYLTVEEKEKIDSLASQGKTMTEIGILINRSLLTVRGYILRNEVECKQGIKKFTQKEMKKITRLAVNGKNLTEISLLTERSLPSVRYYLKKRGIEYKLGVNVLTDSDKLSIKKLCEEGKRPTEITRAVGKTVQTVSNYMRKIGFSDFKKSNPFTEKEKVEIEKLAKEGSGPTKIGEKVGRSQSSISKYLKLMDIPYKKAKSVKLFSLQEKATMKELAIKGKSPTKIAKEISRTPQAVIAYLKRENIVYTVERKNINDNEKLIIAQMHKANKTLTEIGNKLGRYPSVIQSYLKKSNVVYSNEISLPGNLQKVLHPLKRKNFASS